VLEGPLTPRRSLIGSAGRSACERPHDERLAPDLLPWVHLSSSATSSAVGLSSSYLDDVGVAVPAVHDSLSQPLYGATFPQAVGRFYCRCTIRPPCGLT
jgi:hypothetical protein